MINGEPLEKVIAELFPPHKVFVDLMAGDCSIQSYKKPAHPNYLNYVDDNALNDEALTDFLQFEKFQLPVAEVMSNVKNISGQTLIYCNLTNVSDLTDISEMLKHEEYTKSRITLLMDADLDIELSSAMKKSVVQIIDVNASRFYRLYCNYDVKAKSTYFKGQLTGSERQGAFRKSKRWSDNFMDLGEVEKNLILSDILASYLADK